MFQKLKSVATSTGQNMKTGSQSLSTTNPPMLKNEVKNNVFFNIYFTQVFFLKNMYVKQFFSGIQENVMNETIFGENAEKSDLKLAVKAEVSHRFKCVFP